MHTHTHTHRAPSGQWKCHIIGFPFQDKRHAHWIRSDHRRQFPPCLLLSAFSSLFCILFSQPLHFFPWFFCLVFLLTGQHVLLSFPGQPTTCSFIMNGLADNVYNKIWYLSMHYHNHTSYNYNCIIIQSPPWSLQSFGVPLFLFISTSTSQWICTCAR